MFRVLLSTLLGVGLTTAALHPASAQDDKKSVKPKAPPRIAINDPEKLKDDRDFKAQGEFTGTTGAGTKIDSAGAQVVALGEGKFELHVLAGGLPGAGWDGKAPLVGKGEWKDDKINFTRTQDGQPSDFAVLKGDKLIFRSGGGMKKVERKSPTLGTKPPEAALVLFGGPGDETNWSGGKLVELSDGKFLNTGIKSKKSFGAFKAHVEFRLPWMPNSRGQGRANSGVYLQDRYEVQVLDSFGLKGENNECGGIYTQYKPLVNMCFPPMAWQTYDIEFTPAEFDGEKKVKPAHTTIVHNGVKIHDNVELKGPTGGGQPEKPTPGPFQLQNHGDPLVYQNIWVVESK